MTKKSSKKSSSRSSSGRRRQTRLSQTIILIIITIFLCLGVYYAFTGNDPFGLFKPDPPGRVEQTRPVLVGSGGDWWQVYFTDPATVNNPDNLAGSIPEKFIGYINNAQQTIHIAAFEFNLTPVAEALIAAHNRGVEVRWVTDDEYGLEADEEDDHGQFAILEKAGIEVRDDGRTALMHNKFIIFDNKTVWTGSTNLTRNDNFRNNNNVIIMDLPEIAQIYEREFSELWEGKSGPTSPSTLDQQVVMVGDTPVQVFFAAEDRVIARLVPLVQSAQKTIRFMAFSFTHEALGQAVLSRGQAGVDVRGIFENRGSETEFSQLPTLYCAGFAVRQDGNSGTFHHKIFVIDDQIVVTGSLNFSNNADESNDENTIIITNKDIAAQYLAEFERRWAEAREPDPADMSCRQRQQS